MKCNYLLNFIYLVTQNLLRELNNNSSFDNSGVIIRTPYLGGDLGGVR